MGALLVQFPGYTLIKELGQGAFARVYKAATEDGRLVALKVIHCEHQRSAKVMTRVKREIDACSHLKHPNVVQMLDAQFNEDSVFLVLEYLEGEDLSERLTKKVLTLDEVRSVIFDVSSALEYIHLSGLLHRDIKPANIKLLPNMKAVVFDFNLVFSPDYTALTKTGFAVGTPAYIAPEVLNGGPSTVKSDTYALGLVAYELLAQKPLHEIIKLNQLLLNPLCELLPPLTKLNKGVSSELAEVVMLSISADPSIRYPSAKAFCRDFVSVLKECAPPKKPSSIRRQKRLKDSSEKDERKIATPPSRGAKLTIPLFVVIALLIGLPLIYSYFKRDEITAGKLKILQRPQISHNRGKVFVTWRTNVSVDSSLIIDRNGKQQTLAGKKGREHKYTIPIEQVLDNDIRATLHLNDQYGGGETERVSIPALPVTELLNQLPSDVRGKLSHKVAKQLPLFLQHKEVLLSSGQLTSNAKVKVHSLYSKLACINFVEEGRSGHGYVQSMPFSQKLITPLPPTLLNSSVAIAVTSATGVFLPEQSASTSKKIFGLVELAYQDFHGRQLVSSRVFNLSLDKDWLLKAAQRVYVYVKAEMKTPESILEVHFNDEVPIYYFSSLWLPTSTIHFVAPLPKVALQEGNNKVKITLLARSDKDSLHRGNLIELRICPNMVKSLPFPIKTVRKKSFSYTEKDQSSFWEKVQSFKLDVKADERENASNIGVSPGDILVVDDVRGSWSYSRRAERLVDWRGFQNSPRFYDKYGQNRVTARHPYGSVVGFIKEDSYFACSPGRAITFHQSGPLRFRSNERDQYIDDNRGTLTLAATIYRPK